MASPIIRDPLWHAIGILASSTTRRTIAEDRDVDRQQDKSADASAAAMDAWPELPLEAWIGTRDTLHLWTQIVGKLRCRQTAWVNHAWHVALYVTARGLATSPIPHGTRTFDVEFDFIEHRLVLRSSDGGLGAMPLQAQSVAAFHGALMRELDRLDLHVDINRLPNEIPDPVPFNRDGTPREYDRDFAHRYWLALVQADRVLKIFRARFQGKCSPVHYFWGSPDLAVTRFSGRAAPQHPGGIPHLPDWITRDAYSHEVSSAGFWAGGGPVPGAAFYSYAYPEPPGFAEASVGPAAAFYQPELREFVLPYDAVRAAADPDSVLLAFLQDSYEAAANLGHWDRVALERPD